MKRCQFSLSSPDEWDAYDCAEDWKEELESMDKTARGGDENRTDRLIKVILLLAR